MNKIAKTYKDEIEKASADYALQHSAVEAARREYEQAQAKADNDKLTVAFTATACARYNEAIQLLQDALGILGGVEDDMHDYENVYAVVLANTENGHAIADAFFRGDIVPYMNEQRLHDVVDALALYCERH